MKRLMALLLTIAVLAGLVAACAPPPTPEKVVETVVVTKVVEKPVEVTKVVEKPVEVVVTPTPVPKPAVFRTAGGWDAPPAYHGNRFAPGGVGAAWWWAFEPLFHYVPPTRDVVLRLATDYEETADTFTAHLQPNAVWHDGTPFTSKDVWCTFYLRVLHKPTIWKLLDSVETPDDNTVVFKWKEPTLFPKELIAGELIMNPYHLYGKWCDQIPDAMGDDAALDAIREDLVKFKPELPVGTGPFKVKTVTASEMILEKFPDHYAADKVDFDEVRILRWSSNEVIWAFLMAGEIDAAHPATLKDVTEQIMARRPKMELALPTDWGEFAILFNMRRAPFDELNVRKAIAHAIDRKQLREVTYYYAGPVEDYAHGVLKSFEDQWLSKDFLKGLTLYDYDTSKAEALLTEIGFSRGADGNWLDAAGKPLAWEVNAPAAYSDWVLACENVATQLTNFGIPTECRPIDNPVYWPALTAGEYQLAIGWYATWWNIYHPWAGFDRFAFGDGAKRVGLYDNPVLPGPEGTTVNIQDEVLKLGTTFDLDEQKKIVEKLAWVMNENIPALPFLEKRLMMFHDGENVTGWPTIEPFDPIWTLGGGGIERVYVTLMVQGRIHPAK